MTDTRQLRHIEQFYEWELRGRGWLLYGDVVELEAPFHPFFVHRMPMPYIDDGKRPTVLSMVAEWFRKPQIVPDIPAPDLPPIEPFAAPDTAWRVLGMSVRRDANVKLERIEQLFVMCTQHGGLLSFEIIVTERDITIQLACEVHAYAVLRSLIHAYIPEATVHDADRLVVHDQLPTYTADFGLQEEFMRPLATGAGTDLDPYVNLFAHLELLQPGEQAVIQYLIAGTMNQWAESIMRSVTINGKESFFEDAPDMPALAAEKTSKPLVAVAIRAYTQAQTLERASMLINQVSDWLIAASASKHNQLVALANAGYGLDERIEDIMYRQSHRLGMLLNVRELAALAHIPGNAVRSKKLLHQIKTTKAPPAQQGTYCIGTNTHQGQAQPVILSDTKRLEHTHIIGATGTGKSTLLHSLICQDIAHSVGIAILDPHGDLIDSILPYIPEHRIKDVLLIDPSDAEYPVGFNLLHAHSDLEKELLASDLVELFKRFSTSWGDQMNSVFANAILAFLESTKGGTLVDLRRFLIEKPFREQFLNTVTDPQIIYYWQHEYPLLKTSSLGSILTRLDAFLRPKLIRNMVSQEKSLDMEQLMDSNKIILVKLSQGLIGEENSYLLGACIVAKIQQGAMARQSKSRENRTPFFLYIDEFHHFLTPSMSAILTGARKYGLGLVVAHQDMQQVSKHDSELAGSIIANAGTRICFRLGDTDAKKFADGFASFATEDIQNLERGEAIMRIGRAEDDCNVRVLPVSEDAACNLQDRIIALSRETYGTKREHIQQAPNIPAPDVPELPRIITETATFKPKPIATLSAEQQTETIEQLAARTETRQHRYLQTLIKKMAEERGYKAAIELPTPDGKGQVDVSLERDGRRIAVEISVSTKAEWELHNIRKCLDAGYDLVIACSPNKQTLQHIRRKVSEGCSEREQENIIVTDPDQLSQYIEPITAEPTAPEQRIKGYRVSVSYADVSNTERAQKQVSVSRIVREAVKKSHN